MTTILNMPKTKENGLAQWVEPFNRKNLFYEVRYQGGYDKQNETTQDIAAFILKYKKEAAEINRRHGVDMPCVSGLVYCRFRADVGTLIPRFCADASVRYDLLTAQQQGRHCQAVLRDSPRVRS